MFGGCVKRRYVVHWSVCFEQKHKTGGSPDGVKQRMSWTFLRKGLRLWYNKQTKGIGRFHLTLRPDPICGKVRRTVYNGCKQRSLWLEMCDVSENIQKCGQSSQTDQIHGETKIEIFQTRNNFTEEDITFKVFPYCTREKVYLLVNSSFEK